MIFIFWISLFLIVYTYMLYPLLLILLSNLIVMPVHKDEYEFPAVTVLIPAYNEQEYIRQKIENVLTLDYPAEKLKVLVANDGSEDDTLKIAKEFSSQVRIDGFQQNQGKTRLLNKVMEGVDTEIVVFSDASTFLKRDALKKLLRNFADKKVGCVCGLYRLRPAEDSQNAKNEGMYWRYETFIKKKESDVGSILGAHGAIYAIRTELFTKLDEGVINDDYFIPMQIVRAGYRAVYEKNAVGYEQHIASEHGEFNRRVRIAVGNFQQISAFSDMLSPKSGIIAFEFFSHKVLRSLVPIFLLTLLFSNFFVKGAFYLVFMHLHIDFYVFAVAGYYLQKRNISNPVFSLPFYFSMTNLALLLGLFRFFRPSKSGELWKKPE